MRSDLLTSGALIVSLLLAGSPTAVLGAVRAVIVDAFKRQPCGAFTHIGNEAGKVGTPSITNNNTPATIVIVLRISRIETPLFHAVPRRVLRGPMPSGTDANCCSMSGGGGVRSSHDAPAGLGVPGLKVSRTNYRCLAAITSTEPRCVAVGGRLATSDSKKPESFSRQIKKAHWCSEYSQSPVILL